MCSSSGSALRRLIPVVALAGVACGAGTAWCGYSVDWRTIDGGGASRSSYGRYSVAGTIGQPDAGGAQSANLSIAGGFWTRSYPGLSGVGDRTAGTADTRLRLSLPSPNPSRTRVAVEMTSPVARTVEVSIFDIMGRQVRSFAPVALAAGSQRLVWNLESDRGARVATGLYVLRVRAPGIAAARRIVVAR